MHYMATMILIGATALPRVCMSSGGGECETYCQNYSFHSLDLLFSGRVCKRNQRASQGELLCVLSGSDHRTLMSAAGVIVTFAEANARRPTARPHIARVELIARLMPGTAARLDDAGRRTLRNFIFGNG